MRCNGQGRAQQNAPILMSERPDATARLVTHIAALRAARGATDAATQSPRAQMSASAAALVAAATPDNHPLTRLETFLAHVGGASSSDAVPQRAAIPASSLASYTSASEYDQLVRATVARAWDRAWSDYRSGKWLNGAAASNGTDMHVPHASSALGASASSSVDTISGASPWLHTPSSSTRSVAPAPPEQRDYYDANLQAHPHLPADNRRQPLSYGVQASIRRRAASRGSLAQRREPRASPHAAANS